MSDIDPGYEFSGSSPNNNVTAEKLNALVGDAEINTTFLTDKTEESAIDSADYLLFYDTSAGVFKKCSATNAFTAARGRPSAGNLTIAYASASQITVTADWILMRRASSGNLYLATSFNVTADISTGVAVNGLDAGTEAANTWYFVHAISTGAVDRLILSTSSSSPTLPSGYVYSCLLGAVRNNNSQNFRISTQRGNEVSIDIVYDGNDTGDALQMNPRTNSADFTATAVVTNGTFQNVDLARCVPPTIVCRVRGLIGIINTASGSRRQVALCSASNGATMASPSGAQGLFVRTLNEAVAVQGGATIAATTVCGFDDVASFEMPLAASQQISFSAASGSGATGIISMRIVGYTLALH